MIKWDGKRIKPIGTCSYFKLINFLKETPDLVSIMIGHTRFRHQSLLPETINKQPLFGVMAQKIIAVDRESFCILTNNHMTILQETKELLIAQAGNGQVVRSIWVRRYVLMSLRRVTPGLWAHYQQ